MDSASEASEIDVLAQHAARGGRAEHDALINAFLSAVIVIPSASDPSKGQLEPVLTEIDGTQFMVVCDTLAAAQGTSDLARYAVSMKGADVVRGVTPGYGLFVKTPTNGFTIDEPLIKEIRSHQAQ